MNGIQLILKMPLPLYPQTSFTRQVNCHLACQETGDITWKPPLVHVPFHMNQVHILTLHSLKFYCNIVFSSLPFRFFEEISFISLPRLLLAPQISSSSILLPSNFTMQSSYKLCIPK